MPIDYPYGMMNMRKRKNMNDPLQTMGYDDAAPAAPDPYRIMEESLSTQDEARKRMMREKRGIGTMLAPRSMARLGSGGY